MTGYVQYWNTLVEMYMEYRHSVGKGSVCNVYSTTLGIFLKLWTGHSLDRGNKKWEDILKRILVIMWMDLNHSGTGTVLVTLAVSTTKELVTFW